jgi:hypothetical protein
MRRDVIHLLDRAPVHLLLNVLYMYLIVLLVFNHLARTPVTGWWLGSIVSWIISPLQLRRFFTVIMAKKKGTTIANTSTTPSTKISMNGIPDADAVKYEHCSSVAWGLTALSVERNRKTESAFPTEFECFDPFEDKGAKGGARSPVDPGTERLCGAFTTVVGQCHRNIELLERLAPYQQCQPANCFPQQRYVPPKQQLIV